MKNSHNIAITSVMVTTLMAVFGYAAIAHGQAATPLRPDSPSKGGLIGVPGDNKTMLGAQKLFSVGQCQVWGFTWRGHDHVVSICPPAEPTPPPAETKK